MAPLLVFLTIAPSGPHILPRQKAQLFDDERKQKMPPPNEAGQIPELRAGRHDHQPPSATGKRRLNSQHTLAAFSSEIRVLRSPFFCWRSLPPPLLIVTSLAYRDPRSLQELLKFLDAYTRMHLEPDAVRFCFSVCSRVVFLF